VLNDSALIYDGVPDTTRKSFHTIMSDEQYGND
jgi:hypothetical protein